MCEFDVPFYSGGALWKECLIHRQSGMEECVINDSLNKLTTSWYTPNDISICKRWVRDSVEYRISK